MNQFPQQSAAASQVPPGWYCDPMGGSGQRYWDGIAWSEHFTRPAPPPVGVAAPVGVGVPGSPGMSAGGGFAPATGSPGFVVVPNERPQATVGDGSGMVIAGWICAILLPLIGLIIGLVIVSRNDQRGRWIVAVSILMMVLSFLYLQSVSDEMLQAAQQGATGATGAPAP